MSPIQGNFDFIVCDVTQYLCCQKDGIGRLCLLVLMLFNSYSVVRLFRRWWRTIEKLRLTVAKAMRLSTFWCERKCQG